MGIKKRFKTNNDNPVPAPAINHGIGKQQSIYMQTNTLISRLITDQENQNKIIAGFNQRLEKIEDGIIGVYRSIKDLTDTVARIEDNQDDTSMVEYIADLETQVVALRTDLIASKEFAPINQVKPAVNQSAPAGINPDIKMNGYTIATNFGTNFDDEALNGYFDLMQGFLNNFPDKFGKCREINQSTFDQFCYLIDHLNDDTDDTVNQSTRDAWGAYKKENRNMLWGPGSTEKAVIAMIRVIRSVSGGDQSDFYYGKFKGGVQNEANKIYQYKKERGGNKSIKPEYDIDDQKDKMIKLIGLEDAKDFDCFDDEYQSAGMDGIKALLDINEIKLDAMALKSLETLLKAIKANWELIKQ